MGGVKCAVKAKKNLFQYNTNELQVCVRLELDLYVHVEVAHIHVP